MDPRSRSFSLPEIFALFDQFVQEGEAYGAATIACFDDTGLVDPKRHAGIRASGLPILDLENASGSVAEEISAGIKHRRSRAWDATAA